VVEAQPVLVLGRKRTNLREVREVEHHDFAINNHLERTPAKTLKFATEFQRNVVRKMLECSNHILPIPDVSSILKDGVVWQDDV